VFDWVRYWYANGRPSRVEVASTSSDLQYVYGYNTYYLQYNWHGDAVTYIALDGSGGGSWGAYDPWGNPTSWPPPALAAWNYYRWNGAWGYLRLDALNLYYVHGRWYNPDTGLFLSPDANGSYIYYDNDPINKPHRLNAPFIQTGLPQIVNPSCRQTLPGVHPVVNYICDEMVTNASGQYVRQMRQLNTRCLACAWEGVPLWYPGVTEARNNALLADAVARYQALGMWAVKVCQGCEWDHKKRIRDEWHDWQFVYDIEYYFDIWSNIHYGYVGAAAGFSQDTLLDGAGAAQWLSETYKKFRGEGPGSQEAPGIAGLRRFDDPSDQSAIKGGIRLWETYDLALTPAKIVHALRWWMSGLSTYPITGGER